MGSSFIDTYSYGRDGNPTFIDTKLRQRSKFSLSQRREHCLTSKFPLDDLLERDRGFLIAPRLRSHSEAKQFLRTHWHTPQRYLLQSAKLTFVIRGDTLIFSVGLRCPAPSSTKERKGRTTANKSIPLGLSNLWNPCRREMGLSHRSRTFRQEMQSNLRFDSSGWELGDSVWKHLDCE